MRSHDALWEFVAECGAPVTEAFVRDRHRKTAHARAAWLTSRTASKYRRAWRALSDAERSTRMLAHPDSTFPSRATSGILNGRTNAKDKLTPDATGSTVRPAAATAQQGQAKKNPVG